MSLEQRVVELDVGCHPEGGVSGAVLLQTEGFAVLLFNAMSNAKNASGRCEPLGTAVAEFKRLRLTRFGGPNDEGLPEHPLYPHGLSTLGYCICEVEHSVWANEVGARNEASARRIAGGRFDRAYSGARFVPRHFLFSFHDSTFECLADELSVRVSQEPFAATLAPFVKRAERE